MPVPSFDSSVDYYAMMGVPPSSSADDIKRAFRDVALRCHPDRADGNQTLIDKFKVASTAYAVLGDATVRAEYDEARKSAARARGYGRESQGSSARTPAQSFEQMFEGNIGKIYADAFGGGAGRSGSGGPGMGMPSFDQILRDVASSVMKGSGASGTRATSSSSAAPGTTASPGPRQRTRRAREGGKARGATPQARSATPVPEPSGSETARAIDGSILRVSGFDVFSDLSLSLEEAILGTERQIPTLGAMQGVRFPPGTQGGKMTLTGLGIRREVPGQPPTAGNHYVTVQIRIPRPAEVVSTLSGILRRHAGEGGK